MQKEQPVLLPIERRTRGVFVATKLFSSPLYHLYSILLFFLYKDLGATPFQISLFVSAKPLVALLSFYANLFIKGKPQQLKPFLIVCTLLGLFPCFFFPFVENTWFFVASFAVFMMATKARSPAWSEILKINLPKERRSHSFSQGLSLSYLVSMVIPFLIAPYIDLHPGSWRWFFVFFALLHALNVVLILTLPIRRYDLSDDHHPAYQFDSLRSLVLGPWKNAYSLMKQRVDFRRFQIAFMFGAGGLMLIQPVLPVFFEKSLQLSYTQLCLGKQLCYGLAFAGTSPLWASWLNRMSIHRFNAFVTFSAGLFALFLMMADLHLAWFYLAFLVYGLMQAGSQLSWNLSGPLFSKDRDSTLYTGINVAMTGIRGAIAPFLGGFLFLHLSAGTVLFLGGVLCFVGTITSLAIAQPSREEAFD